MSAPSTLDSGQGESAPAASIESVLIVTPRWTRNGGVAAHAIASAEVLRSEDVHVGVLAARNDLDDAAVHLAPQLFDRDAPLAERLAGFDAAGYDVIHFHQAGHPELARHLRLAAPVAISAHDYSACPSGMHYFEPGHECGRAQGPGCLANMLLRGCTHGRRPLSFRDMYERSRRHLATLRTADIAISYSTAVDRHLERNGLRRRAIVPLFSTVPAADGDAVARRVLFAGRLVPAKGARVLLRAAARVECTLTICGDGRELDSLRALADELGVEARFTGWRPPGELAAEIAAAQLIAVPSVWPEPFGLAGIEAMSAGRPVVASATGGIGDWLDDGETGVAVPPGDTRALADAIDGMLADPDGCVRMGEAGRRSVAARFTPARHAEALLGAYRAAAAAWGSA